MALLKKNDKEKYEEAQRVWIYSCLREDLKQYKELVEYVVKMNPPDLPFQPQCGFPDVKTLKVMFPTQIDKVTKSEFNFELGAFIDYYDRYNSTAILPGTLVNRHSKYIYNSPIGWTMEKHSYFFQQLDMLIEYNPNIFGQKFLFGLQGWKDSLEKYDPNMKLVIGHIFNPHENHYFKKEKRAYLMEYGIVKFINNYQKHYNHNDLRLEKKTGLEAFEKFFCLFSYITGVAHRNVFLDMRLIETNQFGPTSIQQKRLYKIMRRKLATFTC